MDTQIVYEMDRVTCNIENEMVQFIGFGQPVASYIKQVGSRTIVFDELFNIVNECDPIPYIFNTTTQGYFYWPTAAEGETYVSNRNYDLLLITDQRIDPYNNGPDGYSSCPTSTGYNIELSNREYFHCRSFVGYSVNNTIDTSSKHETNKPDEEYNYLNEIHEWMEEKYNDTNHNLNLDILPSFCTSYVPNNQTTRIDYTGPTKYQLGKYNKLMSYSYYPSHPVSQTVIPRYVNTDVINSMFNDPQINQYIINQQSGEFILGSHKVVYYVNYQVKELVISVVPINTTVPYKNFTCNYDTEISSYVEYGSNGDGIYLGKTRPEYNLNAIAVKIRYIQQEIFEQTLLPGHGSKSEWTLTLISKDTGNNAMLNFIFKYYYSSIQPETVGGISRYKIQGTGYRYFQQLGFGYLLDKVLIDTYSLGSNNFYNPRNFIGKNIFMTVSIQDDLLTCARSTYQSAYDSVQIISNTQSWYRKSIKLDKWHRDIIYTESMNLVTNNGKYINNKYRLYVKPDTFTITDSLPCIDQSVTGTTETIKREYFGLPNYFFRYSIWSCSNSISCLYQPEQYSTIQYNNPRYNICAD